MSPGAAPVSCAQHILCRESLTGLIVIVVLGRGVTMQPQQAPDSGSSSFILPDAKVTGLYHDAQLFRCFGHFASTFDSYIKIKRTRK